MEVGISPTAVNEASAMETHSEVGSPQELYEIFASATLDFDSWTHLISEIEKTYQDSIKTISLVYESFLSHFPLCHEYWTRYADHKARLRTVAEAVEIFERAVQSATYAVGLWVDYCNFSMIAFAEPSDIRRTFERGLSFVGKDFLSHTLWDMYIKFEYSQQQWSSLAHILIRTLKFPTKSLHKYYDNFREFAAFIEEDLACHCNLEPHSAPSDIEVVTSEDEMYNVIKEMQESSNVELRSKALHKYIATGEQFYCKACQLHEEIDHFENYMDREFFHIKPLDEDQLENWHNYLDFIEKQEDFDWGVKLYERCLIPCANYPEFWMRYVDFMESKGGRELASFALERATQVFLKDVPEVHIFNARFREQIGDIEGARAAFLLSDTGSDLSFVETAIKEANMEKRMGNLATASEVYDKALKVAAEQQKLHIIPTLYINFYRLKYLITGSADAARDLLIVAIQRVPHSRLLVEELINFVMMHEGSRHLNVVDPIIANVITGGPDESQCLSLKDREDLSCLYLKLVDHCGTTHDIRKAWNRHIKSFPHLIRNTSFLEHPTDQLLNEAAEGRERILHLVANHPSRGHVLDNVVQISENEHELLLSNNLAVEPHESIADQYEKEDKGFSEKEKMPESSLQVLQSEDNAVDDFKKLEHQFKDDASRSTDSVLKTVGPSQEAISGPDELTTLDRENKRGAVSPMRVSPRHDQISTHQDEEQEDTSLLPQDILAAADHLTELKFGVGTLELQKQLKPGSLERLSLSAEGKESQDLTRNSPTSMGGINPSIIHGNPSTASGSPYSAGASAKRQKDLDRNESESSSSSPGHYNLIRGHTDSRKETKDAETCRKVNHVLAASEDASAEFDGQSQHQHQQQKDSPPVQGSNAQMGSKMQVPNQNQASAEGNIASNAWPVPTMQPNSLSASQSHLSPQPVHPHPQAHVSQYPVQINEQAGHIQDAQAYNHMLQYQYQQQQYHQQWLQMQQSYFQQPYLLPQQHYAQQQQQPQMPYGPYPPEQLQQQQYQLYQQHEQYQQYQQGYQAWLQQYQQQHDQGYQHWMQQHQLHEYYWFQQYQQMQPQDVQQNHQQGQTITQPHKSMHVTAQPTIPSAPTNGAPSILGSGPSESLRSSSLQQKPQA